MLLTICLPIIIQAFNTALLDEATVNFSNPNYIVYSDPNIYSFNLPAGRYKITCYGAQGGWSFTGGSFGNNGGKGAFVSGFINITGHSTTFYAIVGGQGQSRSTGLSPGGYNGGGASGWCKKWKHHFHHKQHSNGPGGGGGSTEIRLNCNDLSCRIMVAAGGSGASYNVPGAPGGTLTGYNAYGASTRTTQTNGNSNGQGSSGGTAKYYPSSGGGAGYKGGAGGNPSNGNPSEAVSDSGSSYISGFQGCIPHPQITFDSAEMRAGVKDGNGFIQIDQEYECPENCIRCSGQNQCQICDAQYRLLDGLCYSTCPIGSIDRNSYCEKCHSSCLSCSENPTNCTSCFENHYFYDGKCYEKCPVGTYQYGDKCFEKCPLGTYAYGFICEECNISCKECTENPYKCTDCPQGKFLFNNECLDGCPERTVRDGNKCLTECAPNQFLYNEVCYEKCPKGTYKNGIVCEVCQSPCIECRGSSTTCIKCSENMHLFNSKCFDNCPEDYFSYQNECIVKCPKKTIINGNKCVDFCPNGKYNLNGVCNECDSSCSTCENSSALCTSCKKNTYLLNNQCINECPNETFIYQNECVKDCPPGFYLSDRICRDSLQYYGITEEHQTLPLSSKTVTAIGVPILVILFVVGGVFLVLLALNKI